MKVVETDLRQNDCSTHSWTFWIAAFIVVLNFGLFTWAPSGFEELLSWLEFDRSAILARQVWRIMTGNLVHWSIEHLLLDIGAFLIVGWLYEQAIGRSYLWILAFAGLAVGVNSLIFLPEMATYRGFSGIDSGQFAVVLCLELRMALRNRRNFVYLIPAAILFFTKLIFESLTGRMFFGTESLGDIGQPVPLAHVAGAVAALLFFVGTRFCQTTIKSGPPIQAFSRTTKQECANGMLQV